MYIDKPALFTDYYELTMARGYFHAGTSEVNASFDYFFRENPFGGGYVLFCGLNDLLKTLEGYRFDRDGLDYLKKEGFDPEFLAYVENFRFRGTLYAAREGEVVFPGEPVVRVDGTLLECQLIETLLLNILNFQSLIATKASRLRQAAGERTLLDFGLRRSQGLGGIHATRAAQVGGLDGTSNVYSSWKYGIPAGGTMAHSWVQSFDDERTAFRTYAEHFPDDCILLVDTYDTLGSGLPNAITVALELREKGHRMKGIRLDSGDLAYFAVQSRKMLDEAGLQEVQIAASNQLDEHVIAALMSQDAPIDIFGVGTRLVTGQDSPALDGVYKLNMAGGTPRMKFSENRAKATLPGQKRIWRHQSDEGMFLADAILPDGETPGESIVSLDESRQPVRLGKTEASPLLNLVMENGQINQELPGIPEAATTARERLSKLGEEYKRLMNPKAYPVGMSESLMKRQDDMMKRKDL